MANCSCRAVAIESAKRKVELKEVTVVAKGGHALQVRAGGNLPWGAECQLNPACSQQSITGHRWPCTGHQQAAGPCAALMLHWSYTGGLQGRRVRFYSKRRATWLLCYTWLAACSAVHCVPGDIWPSPDATHAFDALQVHWWKAGCSGCSFNDCKDTPEMKKQFVGVDQLFASCLVCISH
jgi:hypothetical protein